ncbi:MAG: TolB family protein, partial [Gemmatimonadales bacterium]
MIRPTMLVAALAGCSALSPLHGKLEVGRDAYAVFVAGKSPAGGDLYAVRVEGGEVWPITFTNVGEMRPRLSPDGISIVFLRGRSLTDSTPSTIWVMNLLNGAERDLALPKGAGLPALAAWSDGGRFIVVATSSGLYRFGAPPASPDPRPVSASGRAAAESSLAVLLGNPVFARVVPCAEAGSLCIATDSGAPGLLAREARDALAWGTDSVAY